jgi:Putative adhesin
MRGLWLTAGAVVTLLALLGSTLGLWRGFAWGTTPTDISMRTIPFEREAVRIEAGKGHVNVWISAGQAGELLIRRSLRWSKERPAVTEEWDETSGTLRLDAVCPGSDQPEGPTCHAEYMLFVPPETDLRADVKGGDLAVNALFGDVRVTTVSGAAHVNNVSGDLWARTGTGGFSGENLRGDKADVEVGSGDVDLSFERPPLEVKAVVRTEGDVDIRVPPRSEYDVDADGENTTVDVGRAPGSSRKIVATALNGTVTVCCQ